METFSETHDLARELGESESKVRRLVRSGVIPATAQTSRGTLLFSQAAVARARERMARERKPS